MPNFDVLDAHDNVKTMGSKTQTEGSLDIEIPKRAIQDGDDEAFGSTTDTSATGPDDEATFISLFKYLLNRMSRGSAAMLTGTVNILPTPTEIVPIKLTRKRVTIINETTTDIRIGNALLVGVIGAALTLEVTCAITAQVATGSAAISFIEEYD